MAKLSIIDMTYEYLKEKNDSASFDTIWKVVSKNINEDQKTNPAVMAGLYSSLVLDNRFALTPDGSWALRDNLKFDDVKKQYANIDFDSNSKKDLDFGDENTESNGIDNESDKTIESDDFDDDEEDDIGEDQDVEDDFGDGDDE